VPPNKGLLTDGAARFARLPAAEPLLVRGMSASGRKRTETNVCFRPEAEVAIAKKRTPNLD